MFFFLCDIIFDIDNGSAFSGVMILILNYINIVTQEIKKCIESYISCRCELLKWFLSFSYLTMNTYNDFNEKVKWKVQGVPRWTTNEPPTNKIACAPSEDSDQFGHPPSLRVFAVRMKKAWVLSYPLSAKQRLWSDWADAQADLSLRWAHNHFVGFVMRRLKCMRR